jgi:predicted metal-dependent hydrolase
VSTITDPEFGEITVRRVARARYVRIMIGNDGRYAATVPPLTPLLFVRQMIERSRSELRKLAHSAGQSQPYTWGQQIGKQHTLVHVPTTMVKQPHVQLLSDKIVVKLPPNHSVNDRDVQQMIRDVVAKVYRKEAKLLLPSRLERIAADRGFTYTTIRFSHSTGRWGSCSSRGVISLNIALMKLPDTLIDYVLVHELCHTREMNHSPAFWREVEAIDPLYLTHRKLLKKHSPAV